MRFTHAIVRPPGLNFADGITIMDLGPPVYELAIEQHIYYCAALEEAGVELIRQPANLDFPDSTFMEDPAIVTPRGALITRPGAVSRLGEIELIRDLLTELFGGLGEIHAPGTLDGGDVCDADGHFYIGLSERTNEAGARQLAHWLEARGYKATILDVRPWPRLLHLKTGLAYIGDNRMIIADELINEPALQRFERVHVLPEEEYAANCVRVNDHILLPSGYPTILDDLRAKGLKVLTVDLFEYRKQAGGMSCLSLRF